MNLEAKFRLLFDLPFMLDADLPFKEGILNAWEREFLREVKFRWCCPGIIPSPKQERVLFGIAAKLDEWWARTRQPEPKRAIECVAVRSAVFGEVRELRCAREAALT